MKRPYNKRSQYWQNLSKKSLSTEQPSLLSAASTSFKVESYGTGYYDEQHSQESTASRAPNRRSGTRENRVSSVDITNKYANIDSGLLPYQSSNGGYSVRDAIILTQKAYFNVMIFRNAVDLMAEFSNSDIYLEGGNAKSKRLINAWLKRVKVNNLKDQFFREYYRSGNVFLYRIDGNLKSNDYNKLVTTYESLAANQNIPVRYILVNPAEIVTNGNLVFNLNFYKKVLSTFEIEKLRAPSNDHERELLKSLSKEVQQKISAFKNPSGETVEILLEPERLTVCL